MAGLSEFNVRLYRDSLNTPWGFRVQGGVDFSQPLTIQRVFTGSPAEGELHRGDVIAAIDGYDATVMLHRDAQETIRSAGGELVLCVRRTGRAPGRSSVSGMMSAPHSPASFQPSGYPRVSSSTMPRLVARDNRPTWRPTPSGQEFGVHYSTSPAAAAAQPQRVMTPGPSTAPARHWGQPLPAQVNVPVQKHDQQYHHPMINSVNQHLNNMDLYQAGQRSLDDDQVDYSFMDKSVSERKRMFMGPTFQPSMRPVYRNPNPRPLRVMPNAAYGARAPEFGWAPSQDSPRRYNTACRAGFEQDSYLPSQGLTGRESPPWSGSLRKTISHPVSHSPGRQSRSAGPRKKSNFSTTLRVGANVAQSSIPQPAHQHSQRCCSTTVCIPAPQTSFHPAYPAAPVDDWSNSPIYRQSAAQVQSAPQPRYNPPSQQQQQQQQQSSPRRSRSSKRAPTGGGAPWARHQSSTDQAGVSEF